MTTAFSVSGLRQRLVDDFALDASDSVAVAFSGGMDSSVLLDALSSVRETVPFSLRALHVDHGLHPQSRQWAIHCENVCRQLNLRFDSGRVDVAIADDGIESAARDARYTWFENVLDQGECLALAHHADDQLETLLFRLVRGAGARGMRGMAADSNRNGIRLIRPMLEFSQQQVRQWAEQRQLHWVDDPANQSLEFDRVYIRQRVVPLLQKRWPSAAQQATRSSEYIADAVAIADSCATEDLADASPVVPLFGGGPGLSCRALAMLPSHRLNHALRLWCLNLTATAPPRGRLNSLMQLVLSTSPSGEIRFGDVLIRRYRDGLYIQRRPSPKSPATFNRQLWHESMGSIDLGDFRLDWCSAQGRGVSRRRLDAQAALTLRLIDPGESVKMRLSGHQRSLRQLCQRLGVPAFDRASLPLLTGENGELIAIAGVCIDDRWVADSDETGISFQLSRHNGLDLD